MTGHDGDSGKCRRAQAADFAAVRGHRDGNDGIRFFFKRKKKRERSRAAGEGATFEPINVPSLPTCRRARRLGIRGRVLPETVGSACLTMNALIGC